MAFPNVRWLLALITRVHLVVYRASGGRLGASALGLRFLLLTHTGRRTGRRHTVPLLYVEHEGRFVVVASNAGDGRDPAWWTNLQARPDAEVQVGRRHEAVRARAASPDEEQKLWPRLLERYPSYAEYRERAERRIPIVLMEPGGGVGLGVG